MPTYEEVEGYGDGGIRTHNVISMISEDERAALLKKERLSYLFRVEAKQWVSSVGCCRVFDRIH